MLDVLLQPVDTDDRFFCFFEPCSWSLDVPGFNCPRFGSGMPNADFLGGANLPDAAFGTAWFNAALTTGSRIGLGTVVTKRLSSMTTVSFRILLAASPADCIEPLPSTDAVLCVLDDWLPLPLDSAAVAVAFVFLQSEWLARSPASSRAIPARRRFEADGCPTDWLSSQSLAHP